MGIIKARVKLSAPPTTGRHLLSMVNCDSGGEKHSLDVWLTERVIAIPVENPCFLLNRLGVLSQVNVTLFHLGDFNIKILTSENVVLLTLFQA